MLLWKYIGEFCPDIWMNKSLYEQFYDYSSGDVSHSIPLEIKWLNSKMTNDQSIHHKASQLRWGGCAACR